MPLNLFVFVQTNLRAARTDTAEDDPAVAAAAADAADDAATVKLQARIIGEE